jgi:hypothetical protein
MVTEPTLPYTSEIAAAREMSEKQQAKLSPTMQFILKYGPTTGLHDYTFHSMLGRVIAEHTGEEVYDKGFDLYFR